MNNFLREDKKVVTGIGNFLNILRFLKINHYGKFLKKDRWMPSDVFRDLSNNKSLFSIFGFSKNVLSKLVIVLPVTTIIFKNI